MNSSFSISIIMPAYNVEKYIAEAIESVLSQSVLPDELIVVNDGSTDATREIVAQYESSPVVKVIDKKNQGLGPARNTGVEAATSEYVYFFDSDDILAIDFVKTMARVANAESMPDIIMFSGESFYDGLSRSEFLPPQYNRGVTGCFKSGVDLYRELLASGGAVSSACLYVSRRMLWGENRLKFKPVLHEDEEMIFPLMAACSASCCLDEVLFYRRVRAGSIMSSEQTIRNAEGVLCALQSMFEIKNDNPGLISDCYEIWLLRVRVLIVSVFRRSLAAKAIFPDRVVVGALLRYGDFATFYRVIDLYVFFLRQKLFGSR
ncbi:glycosyltransferase family 2 protein [Alcanivorax sp. S6407]|uniref:glycosyltransferase family 2 protein n=1 Tax=Alcanivorax sp. S6407 TaxID=2926424 RepID=UPI001FF21C20|nr:glycosyltransferase family A protein [Alcanivorax sp. S6407]MCK0152854.1 glycosyltransferase family 2 protein [Alcanivorax sp. S6407]